MVYAVERALADEPKQQQAAAIRRLLTWYLQMADGFERIFNPGHGDLPLDAPPSSPRLLAFTTHLQARQWAESELGDLVPVLGQVARAGDDVLAWRLPAAVTIIFDLMGRWGSLILPLGATLAVSRKLGDRTAEAWILIHLAEAHENVRQGGVEQLCRIAQDRGEFPRPRVADCAGQSDHERCAQGQPGRRFRAEHRKHRLPASSCLRADRIIAKVTADSLGARTCAGPDCAPRHRIRRARPGPRSAGLRHAAHQRHRCRARSVCRRQARRDATLPVCPELSLRSRLRNPGLG